ncbi:MAG: methyltransferase domain-containing protein [Pseudomonadota bacterium]
MNSVVENISQMHRMQNPKMLRSHYDGWAKSYDREILAHGKVSHRRIASALASIVPAGNQPILDFGCGTGLSGQALLDVGFTNLHGLDMSEGMLAVAESKGIYRSLDRVEPDMPLPIERGSYMAVVACAVLGVGAVPPATLDLLVACLDPGQLLAFTLSDPSLDTPSYTSHLDTLLSEGTLSMLHADYGDHLAGLRLKSSVFVCQKI